MLHLQKILELSLGVMNKKFDNDIKKDATRVPYEISIGKIDNKAKKDIQKEKASFEWEDEKMLKRSVSLILGKKKTNNKILYNFMTKTKSNGNTHIQRITFFLAPILDSILNNKKITKTSLLNGNDSTLYCDCDSFKYHMTKLNKKRGTYYLGNKNKNKNEYPVKGVKPSPNPKMKAGLCKHLKFDVEYITDNLNLINKDIYKYLNKDGMLDKLLDKDEDKKKIRDITNKAKDDRKDDDRKDDDSIKIRTVIKPDRKTTTDKTEPDVIEPKKAEPRQVTKQVKQDIENEVDTTVDEME